mgnify:FL=1
MKNAEERIAQVKALKDVDFVFLVESMNAEDIKRSVESACMEFLKSRQ